jgi:ABC-2 type transport system ATP-binding protein
LTTPRGTSASAASPLRGDAGAATAAGSGVGSGAAPAVELRNASRWYGNVVAVNDVSCTLGPGITGLLGPNGAGKSTVLHMMAGLLRPSAGEVLVHGRPAAGDPDVYRAIGLVPEREALPDYLTGLEFVRSAARLQRLPHADAAAARAIETVDMAAAQNRRIATYSKGMRQRIKVAGALVHEPGVVLLDEPFNGMDPRQRLHMMDVLRARAAQGCTVVISSHILEELNDLAHRVLVMVAGRLAASGASREIRRLMKDRPHTFRLRSSDDRRLAAALLADRSVIAVDLGDEAGGGGLLVRTGERGTMTRNLARAAREAGVRLTEIRPTDESLESVFAYLVAR